MDKLTSAMLNKLPDEPTVTVHGRATIQKVGCAVRYSPSAFFSQFLFCFFVLPQVFHLTGSKKSTVAGCFVEKGKLMRSHTFAVERDGKEIHRGKVQLIAPHSNGGSLTHLSPLPTQAR